LTVGALRPAHAPWWKYFHFRKVHLNLVKCVQNFNFLALIVSDIWGRSQIYTRGAAPPTQPLAEKLIYRKSTWPYLNVCKISTLHSSNSFRDMRASQTYVGGGGGRCAPARSLTGKIFISEKCAWPIWMCVKFQLSSSNRSRDMRGFQIYTRGR